MFWPLAAASKKASSKEELHPLPPSHAAAVAEQCQLLRPELERLQALLQLLAVRAAATYNELVAAGASATARLADLATQQLQGECSAVAALDAYLKRMAHDGKQASTGISLAGTTLSLGLQHGAEKQQQGPAEPEAAACKPEEGPSAAAGARVPAGGVPAQQLAQLAHVFQQMAPGGLVGCSCAAEVLARSAAEGEAGCRTGRCMLASAVCTGEPATITRRPTDAQLPLMLLPAGVLPPEWLALSSGHIQSALRAFDTASSHYLPWRQLLLCLTVAAYPALITGSSWQLCQAMRRLAAADGDGDGRLTQQEWQGVDLWFAPAAGPLDEQGGAGPNIYNSRESAEVKALLWCLLAGPWGSAASAPPQSLDPWLVMQVLCMGSDGPTAAARLEALLQDAPEALRSSVSSGAAAALPAGWLQCHDVYTSACHQQDARREGLAQRCGTEKS